MAKGKKLSLGTKILIGLAVGLALGFVSPRAAVAIQPLGEVFMRLLKMLMVPLVFFSISAGVCKMGDVKRLRTVGLSFVAYILVTSGLCALLGVGVGLLSGVGTGTAEFVDASAQTAKTSFSFVATAVAWVPENVIDAMVRGDMVQVIVFALFLGVALLTLGEKVKTLVGVVDCCSETMLKITEFVMEFSPVGIGAMMANLVVTIGGATAKEVFTFIVLDNVCCLVILVVLYPLLIAALTRLGVFAFARRIVDPAVVAVTTTSSAATLPVSIATAKGKLGIPEDVYGFTLPLGNTCGMNGFAAYLGLMCIFAFHLYGRPVTFGAIMQFVFLGIVLSVGAAGVKGAGIIMSTVLLETLGMPLGIVPIIAAIWPTLEPAHAVVNNVSDLTGTAIVADRLGVVDKSFWK